MPTMMEVVIKVWSYDRPGVLDRIAGLIRRQGWNVSSMTAGDIGEGISQINLVLKGRSVDIAALGEHLDELEGVRSWEECTPDTHVVREMLMFRVRKDQNQIPDVDGLRIVDKRGNLLFAEYTASPQEVNQLLREMRGKLVSCVRSGPLLLSVDEHNHEQEEQ